MSSLINIGNSTYTAQGSLSIQSTLTPSGGNYLGQTPQPQPQVFNANAILTSDLVSIPGNLTYPVPLGAAGVVIAGLNTNPSTLKFSTVDLAHATQIHPTAPSMVVFDIVNFAPPTNLYLNANVTSSALLTWL